MLHCYAERARAFISICLCLLLINACGGGGGSNNTGGSSGGPQFSGLQVVAINPASHAAGVAADAEISATFSAAIDPSSLSASTFLVMDPNNEPVMGSVNYDAFSKKAAFIPATPLQFETSYSAHVTSAIKSTNGAPIIEREWSFTVQGPPVESSLRLGPVNGATGISIKGYAYAVFPGIVDPATVNASSFTLTDPTGAPVAGTAKLRGIHTVVFYPSAELNPNTQYAAKLAKGIRTLDTGSELGQDVAWAFTTAATRTATIQVGDGEFDNLSGLATDADGNVFVTGAMERADSVTHEVSAEVLLSKLTPDGRLLWQTTFTAPNAQPSGVAVAIDANKDAIVVAQLGHVETPVDDGILLLKVNGATGGEVWRKTFGSGGDDRAMDVTLGLTGEIYVAATANASMLGKTALGGNDAVVLRLSNIDGSVIWATQFGTTDDDEIHGIAVDALGAVYVAGNTLGSVAGQANLGSTDFFVAKLTADGVVSVTRLLGTTGDDIAYDVAVSGTSVVFGGSTTGSMKTGVTPQGGPDSVTVALDATLATVQWIDQKGTADFDAVTGTAADEAGAVYLTSMTTTGFDFGQPPPSPDMPADMMAAQVRKLSTANGTELWSRSLVPALTSEPRPDDFMLFTHLQSSDIAVSNTGNVFVAGTLHGGAELDGNVTLPNDSDGVVASFTRDGVKR